MSTPALQLPLTKISHRHRHRHRRRRHAWSRVPLQWHDVPTELAAAGGRWNVEPKKRRWLLALAVISVFAAHALGVWFGDRYSLAAESRPKTTTLALEFVRPPPAPKVEPPPPPPPKKPPPRAAPPPIQTAAVAPSDAPVAAPVATVAAVEPAPPAPAAPPAPVKPAFGGIGYKNNPAPDYPAQAARQGWQGTVLLRVKVLQTGAVDSIEVVKSSGKKLLDDAAVATVNRWVFAPSTQGGAPIDGFATVPIEFKLDS